MNQVTDSWFSIEILPELQADMILALISDHLREDAMSHIQRVWQQNPITRSLPASQAGQVHFLDAYLFFNIRGPMAAQLILDQVQALFLDTWRGQLGQSSSPSSACQNPGH